MLKVGQKAPDLSLPNQDDINISLKNFKGRKILIWFFTKASTGGCTKEGIGFNDEILNFKKENISIIGISKDSIKAQKNFCLKNDFKFDILSYVPPRKSTISLSGSILMPIDITVSENGHIYVTDWGGYVRKIDENGNIEQAYSKVKTLTHATDVLESLK